jgi:hypothetical protein
VQVKKLKVFDRNIKGFFSSLTTKKILQKGAMMFGVRLHPN